jgi:hypothetical protein
MHCPAAAAPGAVRPARRRPASRAVGIRAVLLRAQFCRLDGTPFCGATPRRDRLGGPRWVDLLDSGHDRAGATVERRRRRGCCSASAPSRRAR